MWFALACIRIVLLFDPQPMWATLLWSDPLRTSTFVFTGVTLAALYVLRRALPRPALK